LLVEKGLSREKAYSLVQKNAHQAWNTQNGNFKQNIERDNEIMDFIDPFDNLQENIEFTGWEPVLGGQLAEKAVWVDESKCIGCKYCVHVASNTFIVDEFHGRSRAIRQDGDSSDVIQEAIDTCPVDCIHWVKFEELDDLENSLDRDMFQTFGKPPRMNKH